VPGIPVNSCYFLSRLHDRLPLWLRTHLLH
jgi:hypothetical protein